jgi:pimeloyl-ACP methyl ester carboxylesterase
MILELFRTLLVPIIVASCFLVCGCAATPKVPLDSLSYPAQASGRSENLLILLRGIGDSNAIFQEQGVIDEIRRRHLPFDIVAPDTHLGYYKAHSLEERLKTDVIAPARSMGYKQIWLAGFSMGGLGGLFYLRSHPTDVDGVILISPFLGWDAMIHEIKAAGGIAAWHQVTADPDDWSRLIWSWIREYAATSQQYPPVYLGYGTNDWVADEGPPLLATVLPQDRVFAIPGNHSVETFKVLFAKYLDMLQHKFPVTISATAAPP